MKTIKLFYTKAPKFMRFLITLLMLTSLVASGYFVYTLFLYKGITLLIGVRIAAIAILLLINLIIFLLGINFVLKRRWFTLLIYLILVGSSSYGLYYVSKYYISDVYRSISNLSEKTTTRSSHLVVLTDGKIKETDDLDDKVIGIIDEEANTEQAEHSQAIIDELSLEDNNELKYYEDYELLIKDILNKKLDAGILPGGYDTIYAESEGLASIGTSLAIIHTKTFTIKAETTKAKKLDEPFTMLIMGIDGTGANIDKANSINGDALILITFNPKTLNTTMLSIPRDSYVPIMCMKNNRKNKITHAGIGGEKCMIDTIENFTDIEIDYYAKINFTGVVQLVEDLDGVDVDVPIKFCEQDSQRRMGKYQICLKPGVQHLNGEQALALSRHRKTIDDFRRGYNQQLVVNAMVNKAKSIRNLSTVTKMLGTVSNSMKTNMTTDQLMSLLNLFQKSSGKEPFVSERLYLSGTSKMIYDPAFNATLYNFVLYDGSVDDVVKAMKINLGLKEAKIIKKFSFDMNKPYEVPEIGRGNYSKTTNIGTTLPNFVGSTKEYINSWCSKNNVSVTFNNTTTEIQDKDGKALTQNVKSGTDISTIKGITITIGVYEAPSKPDVKEEETTTTTDPETTGTDTGDTSTTTDPQVS